MCGIQRGASTAGTRCFIILITALNIPLLGVWPRGSRCAIRLKMLKILPGLALTDKLKWKILEKNKTINPRWTLFGKLSLSNRRRVLLRGFYGFFVLDTVYLYPRQLARTVLRMEGRLWRRSRNVFLENRGDLSSTKVDSYINCIFEEILS